LRRFNATTCSAAYCTNTKLRPDRICAPHALDDRLVLQGILFVLHTGIGWEHLPQELGFGCGMTAWRRLRAWKETGVWERLHELLPTGSDVDR
jgi:transposase